MIRLEHVTKTFNGKNRVVEAVKDVTLNIDKGKIFGVIGYSGAGKSTLVRCINLLERPTSGKVFVDGVELSALKEKDLRRNRQKIGMIFQHFNLFTSRTVYENVAFALKYQKITKEDERRRVYELLELVGILDKAESYPRELSGGQKQRVAIARALANHPSVLLCDEATSALDPQTTKTILELLKSLNEKLNLTIVIITHEMGVIKEICDEVAVMDEGYVVEHGKVIRIFADPQAKITQDFISSTNNISKIDELIASRSELVSLEENQRLLRIDFHGESTKEAIIAALASHFNVHASIIYANVEVIQNEILGSLVVILNGERNQDAIDYLNSLDLKVKEYKEQRL